MDHDRAFHTTIRDSAAALRRTLPGIRKGDIEAVHQGRVALRRLRAALALAESLSGRAIPASVGKPLKRAAQSLGTARDWDVLLETTLPDLVASLEAAEIAGLVDRAQHARALAHRRAQQETRRKSFLHAIERLEPLGARVTLPDGKTTDWFAGRWRKLRKRGHKRIDHLSEKALHGVRIDLKKLRYMLDAVSVHPSRRFEADLQRLQKRTGRVNDLRVARELVAELRRNADGAEKRAARDVERRLDKDMQRRRRRLRKPWRALRGAPASRAFEQHAPDRPPSRRKAPRRHSTSGNAQIVARQQH
jgi:CHAD domain-containing protein